jgi:hypothetical protein
MFIRMADGKDESPTLRPNYVNESVRGTGLSIIDFVLLGMISSSVLIQSFSALVSANSASRR